MTNTNKMYLSPRIKVVEMENQGVFCTSATVDELENGGVIDWFE